GMMQYLQDNDETFPCNNRYNFGGNNYWEGHGWGSAIYPYVKSTEVYHCPDDPTPQTKNLNGQNEIDYPISYAMNSGLDGHGFSFNNNPGARLSTLTAPVYTVLLMEAQGAQCDLVNINDDGFSANPTPAGNGGDGGAGWIDLTPNAKYAVSQGANKAMGIPARFTNRVLTQCRHTNGANFTLADGHSKYLLPEQVSSGDWNTSTDCDQDMGGTPCVAGAHVAAGTGFMGQAPKNFRATFSPR
ncbi:MAG: hypothetical protein JWQ02_4337, partial [Capsulimonas sp.]|nr:hypothetical protein [Capsulimonas sp.]